MEKPEILYSVHALWCASTANAAFALAGGVGGYFVGPAVAAFVCNAPAVGAVISGGTAL